jgi:hypothetical protein
LSRFDAIRSERKPVAPEPAPAPKEIAPTPAPGRAPARTGKKAVGGYFSPELSMALNMLALERSLTLQAVLGEAFDDLLRKYGKHPFGER